MAMLGEKFPDTQFVVTGVLGPHSNAHGPNEFLHIGFAKRVAASIAQVWRITRPLDNRNRFAEIQCRGEAAGGEPKLRTLS